MAHAGLSFWQGPLAVLRVLELESYRAEEAHRPGFIDAALGISIEEERQCVQALTTSGQLEWEEKRYRIVAESQPAQRVVLAHFQRLPLAGGPTGVASAASRGHRPKRAARVAPRQLKGRATTRLIRAALVLSGK